MDKLVIDGQVKAIKKDSVNDVNSNTVGKAVKLQHKIHHTPVHTHQGHSIQGHSVKITDQDSIIPVLHAIYDERVARASHNIYAYRVKRDNRFLEHYDDDGEWGAGAKLLELMRENSIEDTLVCTTRWCGERHLGRTRFDLVLNAAKQTLGL